MHKKSVLCFAFIVLLWHSKPGSGFNSGVEGATVKCIERERQALLKFKQEAIADDYYYFDVLPSWGSEEEKSDCCRWRGVGCDNRTGYVALLDLHDMKLGGNISDSLLELPHLNYLDLSNNWFYGNPFPNFVGSLRKLTYLNLAGNGLVGTLSYQLGNLSRLQSLDLSDNSLVNSESLAWLSCLSSLEHLDLSANNLSKASDWMQAVNDLPNLEDLRLSFCGLSSIVLPSLSFVNSSKSLAVLDVSHNNLSSAIYPWLFNFSNSLVVLKLFSTGLRGPIPNDFGKMTSLRELHIFSNQLKGAIPRSVGEMCSLRVLYLSNNNLTGPLSRSLRNMHGCLENSLEDLDLSYNGFHGSLPDFTRFNSMRELDLSSNQLNGSLPKRFSQRSKIFSLTLSHNKLTGPLTDVKMLSSLKNLQIDDNRLDGNVSESIGSLSKLELLDARGNSMKGVLSEAHFSNLSKLDYLDLSFNSLALKFGSNWAPTFQLRYIYLASCKLGPHFPEWLRNQRKFSELDISGAGIADTIPNWFWDLSAVGFLNFSHNEMKGILPDLSSKYDTIFSGDFSFNRFEGAIPIFPTNTERLDLSNNKFSGPSSRICKIAGRHLVSLDLSDNLLSGQLPNCFMQNFPIILVLNLANNNISGEIPSSMGSMTMLQSLSLHNNSFSGELPSSLKNCSNLQFLDLSGNKFLGELPAWIGENLLSLKFLSLESNELYGIIPPQLCQLTNIQILDLSGNNITGIIPKCINHFTAMIQKGELSDIVSGYVPEGSSVHFVNRAWVEWKGRQYQYKRNLGLLRIIHFAGNKLIGEIPEEITGLLELVALNLSGNNLIGVIPQKIGQLKQLESLDLSGNHLTGVIPATLADLNFLSYLNLSYNNLSGRIPVCTQLQSFNASVFAGNLALCGLPITQKCPGDEQPQSTPGNDHSQANEANDDEFSKWLYTGMGIGFAVFFWGVSGALLLKRSWRHAYFQFLDESWDWLHVQTVLHKARLQQKFQKLRSCSLS